MPAPAGFTRFPEWPLYQGSDVRGMRGSAYANTSVIGEAALSAAESTSIKEPAVRAAKPVAAAAGMDSSAPTAEITACGYVFQPEEVSQMQGQLLARASRYGYKEGATDTLKQPLQRDGNLTRQEALRKLAVLRMGTVEFHKDGSVSSLCLPAVENGLYCLTFDFSPEHPGLFTDRFVYTTSDLVCVQADTV